MILASRFALCGGVEGVLPKQIGSRAPCPQRAPSIGKCPKRAGLGDFPRRAEDRAPLPSKVRAIGATHPTDALAWGCTTQGFWTCQQLALSLCSNELNDPSRSGSTRRPRYANPGSKTEVLPVLRVRGLARAVGGHWRDGRDHALVDPASDQAGRVVGAGEGGGGGKTRHLGGGEAPATRCRPRAGRQRMLPPRPVMTPVHSRGRIGPMCRGQRCSS